MSDLDERLGRYARHLDEHVSRFEVPADGPPAIRELDDRRPSAPTGRPSRQWAWLATAAAVCLLIAGSLAWWRSTPTAVTGRTDTTSVTSGPVPEGDGAAPLRWAEAQGATGGWSVPVAVTSFKGGLLAVSGDGLFKPFSWWSPDGRTFDGQVTMDEGPGAPKAIDADTERAVAVGDGAGTAKTWVTVDGRTWEIHEIVDASSVRSVASSPFGFIVVGSSRVGVDGTSTVEAHPAAWSSPDGRTWTRVAIADPGAGELTDVAASDDDAVIVGAAAGLPYAQRLAVGADGTPVWSSIAPEAVAPTTSPALTAVAWVGDRFVSLGGGDSTFVWESADGGTFTSIPLGPLAGSLAASAGFADVAGVDGMAVVIADAGPDAEAGMSSTWTQRAGGDWEQATPIDLSPCGSPGSAAVTVGSWRSPPTACGSARRAEGWRASQVASRCASYAALIDAGIRPFAEIS